MKHVISALALIVALATPSLASAAEKTLVVATVAPHDYGR